MGQAQICPVMALTVYEACGSWFPGSIPSISQTGETVVQPLPASQVSRLAGFAAGDVASAFLQALLSKESVSHQAYSHPCEWSQASHGSVSTNTHHKTKHTNGHTSVVGCF